MIEHAANNHTIGVLGGGQLGRMMALAGIPLGFRFRFLDPSPYAVAAHAGELVVGDFADREAIGRFVRGVDLVTFEFENVPSDVVDWMSQQRRVHPSPALLQIAQDRLREKREMVSCGIEVGPYVGVATLAELRRATASIGFPCVLKTRRMGYDGKGQVVLRQESDVARAWTQTAGERESADLILEAFIEFEREVSILAARSAQGKVVFYPTPTNLHREGMLRLSRVPIETIPGVSAEAWRVAEQRAREAVWALMERHAVVGVVCVEMFVVRRGETVVLLGNEIAPRVHNSGHWTMNGAVTSQFENHVRAIAGLPLGDASLRAPAAAMVNLIGEMPDAAEVLSIPGASLHSYAKHARAGRKLGHINIVGTAAEVEAGVARCARLPGADVRPHG